MKKFFSTILIAAALPFLVGCSDGDDNQDDPNAAHAEKVATAPDWNVNVPIPEGDITGKPDWEVVDFFDSRYDKGMTAIVQMQEILLPYCSDKDLMAAIINGEVRELAYPVDFDNTKAFMLYIPFTSGEDEVEIQYYNAKKDQTHLFPQAFSVFDDTVGSESDFELTFYIIMNLTVVLNNHLPFPPSSDDKMAVFFEDGSCCGIGVQTDENMWEVNVYGDQDNRPIAYIRYYSANAKTVYTMKTDLKYVHEEKKKIVFNF